MREKIVVIGCGDSGRSEAARAAIEMANDMKHEIIFHTVPKTANRDDLATVVDDFTKKDYKVLLVDDGVSLTATLPDIIESFKLTSNRLGPEYIPSLKELNKPPVYPKKNWKRKLKKNRK